MKQVLVFLCLALVLTAGRLASETTVFYGYTDGTAGGVAAVAVDPADGSFGEHRSLFEVRARQHPDKIRRSADGSVLGVSLVGGDDAYALYDLGTDGPAKMIPLGFEPDEHRAFGDSFVLGGSKGHVVVINGRTGEITARWNSRDSLRPAGHKVEDIQVWEEVGKAALSFQKDSRSGKYLGSRLVWMDLPDLEEWVDVPLPRSRPDLHMEGTRKEKGPNPEVVRIEPEEDVLLLTLDLYGALWIADLEASLEGDWRNTSMVPTAPDGSWGHTFPDRVGRFLFRGEPHYLVINSGPDTGYGVFRLRDRSFVGFQEGEVAAASPVYFPDAARIATVVSGKVKARGDGGLDKHFAPEPILRIFRIDEWKGEGPLPETTVDLPGPAGRIIALAPDGGGTAAAVSSPVAVVAVDADEASGHPASILTVEVTTGEILDSIEARGRVTRLE